jgi:hypothetical protein
VPGAAGASAARAMAVAMVVMGMYVPRGGRRGRVVG